ncbi:MCE family protein [Rhodococcus maanshanensis]|uniref:Phospholipid/cholesterol/gamma-HCH transport system substrate-binding protein n=1 Tax=Rhodococcus maanshanensis TaxID=183556 RepID=A0A1H7KUZ0_9NOCA|nr:MCE family protein [Rhodococcus maanshanensis]SEK90350.1 phospholipid/cholesterol/gamma-HCH transport system substrate-binding protein [Rhodococcus maanshanensis]
MTTARLSRVATALALAVGLVAAGWFVFARTDDSKTVYANFAYVNGIYPGSKVTVLGVPVGSVIAVQPEGTSVRVTMTVPGEVELPADANAYVLNPSVISDRHLELGPTYGGGPKLEDGAEIPVERSHAPIDFDGLMGSISTLTDALGGAPDRPGGSAGDLLTEVADNWRGNGDQFNAAIKNLSAATGVVGARAEDIGALVRNLNTLMTALDARQVSLDTLVADLGELGDEWSAQKIDIAGPLQDLRVVLDQVNSFMTRHGDDVGTIAENTRVLGDSLAANQAGLAEFMDVVPLLMQNLSNTVGPDNRGRIRLNVSTALTQFAVAKPLCDAYPLPLCTGAGFTNPISFPVSASDPLGIVSAVTGGALPPRGN